MTGPIRLTVLDLDTATARRLRRCNDLDGTAVVTVRPDTRRPAWLARDLMAAVGIRHGLSGQTRRDADDRQLVPMWLHAHDVRDVIIVGVESLPGHLLPEVIEQATLAGATLWLVADHVLPDGVTDVLCDWPVTACPPDEFADRWLAHAPEPSAAPDENADDPAGDGLPPAVPHVDFVLFRATARHQLPAHEFAAIDARFLDELHAALDALSAGSSPPQALRDAARRCQSATAVVVTTRAVQAAAWRAGHHLRVDLDALLAFDDHAPVATAADPATWQALRAYRQPWRQAACILALLEVALTTQLALTLDDLDADRPAVRIDGTWRALPDLARPTLRALAHSRLAAGAAGTDPLLAKVDGSPVTTRTLADALNAVRQETGLRLTVGQVERDPVTTARWARRRRVLTASMET